MRKILLLTVLIAFFAIVLVQTYPAEERVDILAEKSMWSVENLFRVLRIKRRDNTNFTSYYLFFHILSRYFKCT